MVDDRKAKWVPLMLVVLLRPAEPQYAVPYPAPYPQPVAVPHPVPVPYPVPVLFAVQGNNGGQKTTTKTTTTTTTTTTTQAPQEFAIAFPMPMPMPMPMMGVPGYCSARPKATSCPPCPPCVCAPSCTPPFYSYCSPCHQKCRCQNGAPRPMPMVPPMPVPGPAYPFGIPMAQPPPVVVVPFPPMPKSERKQYESDSDTDSDFGTDTDTSDSDSCSSDRKRRPYRIRRRPRKRRIWGHRRMNLRRGLGLHSSRGPGRNNRFKPVLSYISDNGGVRYKKKISHADAIKLMSDSEKTPRRRAQQVRVSAGSDHFERPQVVIESGNLLPNSFDDRVIRKKKVYMKPGQGEHVLGEGKKTLVFRPPEDRKITNLSVSFQLER